MSMVIEPEVLAALPGCTVEVYASREEWLANRGLGASESPSVLNVGYAEDCAVSVWGRKRGLIPPMESTQTLRIGQALEPVILELFSEETGHAVKSLGKYSVCRSKQYPWLTASLDGLIVETDEGAAIVEAKNVGTFMGQDWDDDDQPLKFQIQTQHQMEVGGLNVAYSVGLIGGNSLKWVKSYRNQRFIDAMLPQLAEFQELVESETEPAGHWLVATEATKKALAKIHPLDNGETIVLPAEAMNWHAKLVEAKAIKKAAETDVIRNSLPLQQAIGDNSYGLLADGSRYSWKHQDKAIYTCGRCGFCKRSEPFPVLRHGK